MITGGTLVKDRLVMTTESAYDAKLVKSGISGRNDFVPITPYSNRVTIQIEGSNLIMRKENKNNFIFEEVHGLLKKIQMFGRISSRVQENMTNDARILLRARLTLFFPTEEKPAVELSFAYNWASIEIHSKKFALIFAEIKSAIQKIGKSEIKIFTNNIDIISFHNYAMNGIYINKPIFEAIFQVFINHHILVEAQRRAFLIRCCAFGVKSVAYMEARKQGRIIEDNFEITDKSSISPNMGDIDFFIEIVGIFQSLSKNGKIDSLTDEQKQKLRNIIADAQSLKQYNLPDTMIHSLTGFVSDFQDRL